MENDSLNANGRNPVTVVFWIIGAIAVLWNIVGVYMFITDMLKDEVALSLMSEAERALHEDNPLWHKVVFGIATFGGLLGSVFLLMRKKLASILFLISLIAVVIQFGYGLLGTNLIEVRGNGAVMFSLVIVLIAAFLLYYSKKCEAKEWLN